MIKKVLWAIIIFCLLTLAVVPLIDLAVLSFNSFTVSLDAKGSMTELGQMGDFFGGHTAAFSGLLSVALILYFSVRQAESQHEHFEKQIKISKEAADLASLSNIYNHYSTLYNKEGDAASILEYVAKGHRRWAIRESFSIIDPEGALENHRVSQVKRDFDSLIELLRIPQLEHKDYSKISELTSSLLLDKRLVKQYRELLWELYELLRQDPSELINPDSELHRKFNSCRFDVVQKC